MCGLAGFIEHQHLGSLEILKNMISSLSHRGPDAEGFILEGLKTGQVALAHRRLSILDISSLSNQPMQFDDLNIAYNGEIYNFAEIKIELELAGYSFQSNGDTEVILKAFHKWGICSIVKFRGMFAISIFDKKTRKLFLIRDRVGVKPLYYYHHHNSLVFSSEIRAISYHPSFKKTLCTQGLNLYFQYGYIIAPWTIFAGVKKVLPGHYLEYDFDTNTLKEEKYWNLSTYYSKPKLKISEKEAEEQLHNIMDEAFALRMVSDMPVGVLLSGGIDSSLVASILQSKANKSIDTFTIGFEEKDFDESNYAKHIAEHLGTNHHEEICTWKQTESIIFNLPDMYDEPFADSSAIPTALVAQFSKKHVSVVLSGDGGDEMFCGYRNYTLSDHRFNKIQNLPFKTLIATMMRLMPDPIMSLYKLNYDLYNRYLKFKSIFSMKHVEDKYKSITKVFTTYDINKLMKMNSDAMTFYPISENLMSLERMMLVDFNHYLPDDLLVKVDRATMFHSLEGREPLLDNKILEFAAQLPMHLKFEKAILKKILGKYIPTHYFERKKQGFGIPVNRWLRNELHHLIRKYLNEESIKKTRTFQ